MVRKAALAIALVCAGCDRSESTEVVEYENSVQNGRIDAIEERLTNMQAAAPSRFIVLKPDEKAWQWLTETSGGFSVRIGWDETTAAGNGSRVKLSIGNPLAMGLRSCEVQLMWSLVDEKGVTIAGTHHEKVVPINADIPPGGFAFPEFDLADIPPAKLGTLIVQKLDCRRTFT